MLADFEKKKRKAEEAATGEEKKPKKEKDAAKSVVTSPNEVCYQFRFILFLSSISQRQHSFAKYAEACYRPTKDIFKKKAKDEDRISFSKHMLKVHLFR